LAYLLGELNDKIEQFVLCAKDSSMEAYCQKNGFNYYAAKKRSGFDLSFAKTLKKLCRNLEIDLCHLHDAHAHTFAIIATYLGNQTPLVLSRRVDFPIKNNFSSKLKYTHPNIKKILCVSEKIKEITAPDIKDKSKLEVVYSGIDLKKFAKRGGKLRKELKLSEATNLIGNTSALADHKDYFTFLDVAEKVIEKEDKVHFVIFGKGPLEEKIKSYARNKKLNHKLTFLGYRADIPEVLADLDIFLITSKTEGLGTSIIDAFACEVPVVATAAGGIPELVENEKSGLLCPVKDVDCLTKSVIKIIHDQSLAKSLKKGASEKVKLFSKKQTAKDTLKNYTEIWS
jgi:glycosyltransferase involved in cell wall biosynthesis